MIPIIGKDVHGRYGARRNPSYAEESHPDFQVLLNDGWIKVDEDFPHGQYYLEEGELILCTEYTLEDLPYPSKLIINGDVYFITEQTELEFDAPGKYVIEVIPDNHTYAVMVFEYEVSY